MAILVTGAAGFIGYHVAKALLARGDTVIGVDNMNDYYDVRLKEARLELLQAHKGFSFHKLNIADREGITGLALRHPEIEGIIHLAAQAGVRYSLVNPYKYIESNVMGHVVMLEAARLCPNLKHFVYSSSSSVYGANEKVPFAVEDAVEQPVSLYAATKRSDELISHTYSHLYKIPQTGLRFFTVYGPWGRPDMSPIIFTKAIIEGKPLPLFNHGKMKRDFTYIDDIVAGVLAAYARPPKGDVPCCLYNLGNDRPEELSHFLAVLEQAVGKKAIVDLQPMQPGDVPVTMADITTSRRDFGFNPQTSIDVGLPKFVAWYRQYYAVPAEQPELEALSA